MKRWAPWPWLKGILMILIIGIVMFFIFTCYYDEIIITEFSDWTKRGQFGDSFGAINAFFSALAFIAIIATLFLQREDLKIQAKQLNETIIEAKETKLIIQQQVEAIQEQTRAIRSQRSVMERQRDFMGMQIDLMKDERKINTFYQLLNRKDEITASVSTGRIKGKAESWMANYSTNHRFTEIGSDMPHYFNSVSILLNYIEHHMIDHKFYSFIVISGLTEYELIMLFIYGLSPSGNKMKSLAEKFGLYRNLDCDKHGLSALSAKYDQKAFEDLNPFDSSSVCDIN